MTIAMKCTREVDHNLRLQLVWSLKKDSKALQAYGCPLQISQVSTLPTYNIVFKGTVSPDFFISVFYQTVPLGHITYVQSSF